MCRLGDSLGSPLRAAEDGTSHSFTSILGSLFNSSSGTRTIRPPADPRGQHLPELLLFLAHQFADFQDCFYVPVLSVRSVPNEVHYSSSQPGRARSRSTTPRPPSRCSAAGCAGQWLPPPLTRDSRHQLSRRLGLKSARYAGERMTKADLANAVSKNSALTKQDAEIIIQTVLDSIIETLKRGGKVALRGFGGL